MQREHELASDPFHHRPSGDRPPPPSCSPRTLARNGAAVTHEMYAQFFAEDVAQLSVGERKAVQKVARNFYRWQGHAATVNDLLDALANPPKVEP